MAEAENSTGSAPEPKRKSRWGKLRTEKEFQRLRQEGLAWSGKRVVVRVAANGLNEARLGIVTSKRLGNAVKRNRARRLVREAARRLVDRFPTGWDVVVIARGPAVNSSMAQVLGDLEYLLRRAGLIERPPEQTGPSTGGREFSE